MGIHTKEQLELVNQQLKEMAGIYRKAISRREIFENEFWIWYTLVMIDGEHSQQEICKMWSLSKQTVNTIIMHMVQNGFATLEVVPGTRNKKIILLTEKGITYGNEIVMPIASAEQKAFERLDESDRAAFIGVLKKYNELLRDEIDETAD